MFDFFFIRMSEIQAGWSRSTRHMSRKEIKELKKQLKESYEKLPQIEKDWDTDQKVSWAEADRLLENYLTSSEPSLND